MKAHQKIIFTSLIFVLLSTLSGLATLAAPPQQGELAIISYPADNEVVRGIISVTGSAVHPSFERYQLAYAVEPVTSNDQWILIGGEKNQQVVNGELAIWDTTNLPDGSYSLRLRVVRLDGNYGETEVKQVVIANTQPTETPAADPEETVVPTVTPTALPPTPTIIIEVPVEATATPRTLIAPEDLPTPRPAGDGLIPIPKVILDTSSLQSSCLWGGGGMLVLFLFFGFLSAIRLVVLGFAKRIRRK